MAHMTPVGPADLAILLDCQIHKDEHKDEVKGAMITKITTLEGVLRLKDIKEFGLTLTKLFDLSTEACFQSLK